MTATPISRPVGADSTLAWLALLLFAVGVYALGLDNPYIPSNGDEMVYAHIARMTAASSQWLPLASELGHMRNTKPPLLFWQAMVAGDWGQRWQLWALRVPSVIYTLLITAAIAGSVKAITRRWQPALLAACVYLGFFCTFRYGRPFLTSAPETFWLNLPLFCLMWWRLAQTGTASQGDAPARITGVVARANRELGWGAYLAFGLAFGLGLAYKSFALIVPASAAFWCALLLSALHRDWPMVRQATLRTALSALIALGVFALWFVLDPDPASVWREFVVGENAAKLSDPQGYWKQALGLSGGSAWAQLLAYVQNAGLLAFVVLGLGSVGVQAVRQRSAARPWPPELWILLAWLTVWLLVFTLPSQRSARYVIPAMPALAMLLALNWTRIARGWFLASMVLVGLFLVVLTRIGWAMHTLAMSSELMLAGVLLMATLGAAALSMGAFKPAWTRFCTVLACLTVFGLFNTVIAPFGDSAGRYEANATRALAPSRIAVPNGFNGQFERFQFVLPGHVFVPYDSDARARAGTPDQNPTQQAQVLQELLATHDAVVWSQDKLSQTQPPCVPQCTVLDTRWEVKGRHQSGDITLANVWTPQLWLFRREWLLQRVGVP